MSKYRVLIYNMYTNDFRAEEVDAGNCFDAICEVAKHCNEEESIDDVELCEEREDN